MEPNNDKNLERIVNKAMSASEIETPSANFTVDVMSQIEALETKRINYTPIISGKSWVIIIVVALAIVISLNVFGLENEATYLDRLNAFVSVDFSFLESFSNLKLSNTVIYAILLFGIMFGIQIPILKYYHTQKLKL